MVASDSSSDPAASSRASDTGAAERARTIAGHLLDVGAVELRPDRPFTWSSGLAAPIYCDNRLTISRPDVRRAIRDAFAAVLRAHGLTSATIAGTATAGIPHAAWLAEAVDQPMAYVRSSAKGHGKGARIEGVVEPGDQVVVLEDLISTGGSALDAVAAVRETGATVRAVLAIFSYELEEAAAAFRAADVPRHVLTTFSDLIALAHERGDLSAEALGVLKAWRADPEGWSIEHGGDRPD
jgi:orotate phosphoribosyltransferase